METIENNKLIADFLGYNKYIWRGHTMYIFEDDNHRAEVDLHYHSDWNWLMGVIEKIESIEDCVYQVDILQEGCKILKRCSLLIDKRVGKLESDTTKIESVYIACVEFIKWYNNQNNFA